MNKEKRLKFIKERGFNNISEFARAVGEDPTNTAKVFRGEQKPKLDKLLKYALALDAEIEQMLMLFYNDEMKMYIKERNKKK